MIVRIYYSILIAKYGPEALSPSEFPALTALVQEKKPTLFLYNCSLSVNKYDTQGFRDEWTMEMDCAILTNGRPRPTVYRKYL